ncbi:calmodulin-binding receptor-like cytoplasmic kinase 2 [Selaginella moellendorffii]|uniref:calmodulin-binding receptor-like cytoplasmic kinase 2 n=1 Tax=Selaginella moellendorffii TaxID=88036 RepID=UPI000D1C45B1|nr:calmodulin-binding receptor-like cytoplasmic kinase 2 [Selaginella moellendorffii]|eukprot:XP_024545089.1 calmodulin-binding receptor-like cytoplasmic kinase 2 [Selaginella moellendorffii]
MEKNRDVNVEEASHLGSNEAVSFSARDINQATGNYSPSRKIGQGGFGTVYYGKLRDGTPVAVKRAKKVWFSFYSSCFCYKCHIMMQNAFETRLSTEFKSELSMLSRVEHMNLVRLFGYCDGKDERALVVEYVPNGNLREHLDDEPIIHRDVKSSNILLTHSFRAKVADFGFSRAGPMDVDATHVSTEVKGTAGYLDTEYLYTKKLTPKSDVYSFGIVMVETMTARRPIELKRSGEERVTIRWAWKKFEEGNILQILDPNLEKHPEIAPTMEKLAELAFRCAAPSRKERPSMQEVSQQLTLIRKDTLAVSSSSDISFFTSSERVGSSQK